MKLEETELIDRYCRGELSADEQNDFEERLKQDKSLQEEVALHNDLLGGMQQHFGSELKSKLIQLDQPEKVKKLQPKRIGVRFAIAASIALLLLAAYLLLTGGDSSEEVFHAYYQPYPNIINPAERSAGQSSGDFETAMQAYEQGNYQEAITIFTQADLPLESSFSFYLALSYLEVSDYDQAINLLQEVIDSGNQAYHYPAMWYQSMAYLAGNKTPKARKILEALQQSNDVYYSERAKKALDDL